MSAGGTLAQSRAQLSLLSLEPVQDPVKRETYHPKRKRRLAKVVLIHPLRKNEIKSGQKAPEIVRLPFLKVEAHEIQHMLCEREKS